MSCNRNITRELAEYALDDHWEKYSDKELSLLKTSVIDWIAAAYSGLGQDCQQSLLELAKEEEGFGKSTVIGQEQEYSLLWAALLNGIESHALDFDDIHVTLPLHLTTPVCSAALVIAEKQHNTGREFLQAVMNGMQVIAAISAAVAPVNLRRHWHCSGTIGIFGATAASAYLLKLTSEQLCHAFGIAVSKTGGVLLNKGTMTKPLQPAQSGRNGLEASLLARLGFTACQDIFDSSYLADMYGAAEPDKICDRLYGTHVISELRYKRYPCGAPTHSGIINSRILSEKYGIKVEEIESITAEPYPDALRLVGIQYPETGLQGKFSIPFVIAAQLVFGKVTEETFSEEVLRDPRVQKLLTQTTMKPNPDFIPSRGAKLTITMKNGAVYENSNHLFTDNIDAGPARKAAEEKLYENTEKYVNHETAEGIIKMAASLDTVMEINVLTKLLRAKK